jgi:protein-disulfide isomerase
VVAEVSGAPILASELEQRVAGRLARLRQEEYEIRRQTLEELIAQRLVAAEAAKRQLAPEELLRQEVDAKATALPPAQVEAIYEQNKDRFAGQPRADALARIRDIVDQRAKAERRAAFEKELRDSARVAVRLEAPRATVPIPAGAAATGPADAPVTIVEFTDYQCPYCHRAQGVIDQVLSRYSGKVRFVHLDFPLDGHPGAVPAARAVRCAGEQGKFWEYHRSLMTAPGTLDEADLEGRASALRLDGGAFGACLSSSRHDGAIQASLRQGEELGVTGTPAYFVNGRMLSGARPVEAFTELIDAELAGR